MSHDLDVRPTQDDDRTCQPRLRPLHDEGKPRFGRYIGLINARD